jgi:hypothetical protein
MDTVSLIILIIGCIFMIPQIMLIVELFNNSTNICVSEPIYNIGYVVLNVLLLVLNFLVIVLGNFIEVDNFGYLFLNFLLFICMIALMFYINKKSMNNDFMRNINLFEVVYIFHLLCVNMYRYYFVEYKQYFW